MVARMSMSMILVLPMGVTVGMLVDMLVGVAT